MRCKALTKNGRHCRRTAILGDWCLEHHPVTAPRASEPPTVDILYETAHQWTIRCPYCHKLHNHGKGEGHRVAHCLNKTAENVGYIIKQK